MIVFGILASEDIINKAPKTLEKIMKLYVQPEEICLNK